MNPYQFFFFFSSFLVMVMMVMMMVIIVIAIWVGAVIHCCGGYIVSMSIVNLGNNVYVSIGLLNRNFVNVIRLVTVVIMIVTVTVAIELRRTFKSWIFCDIIKKKSVFSNFHIILFLFFQYLWHQHQKFQTKVKKWYFYEKKKKCLHFYKIFFFGKN